MNISFVLDKKQQQQGIFNSSQERYMSASENILKNVLLFN